MKIEYNKSYVFDFTGKISFGDLSKELLNTMFRDGRVASKFLENHIPIWFPDLEYVDAHGYDHVHKESGRKFDNKNFTARGTNYAPSVMVGAGRKIDKAVLHEHANEIDYILTDISNFPTVNLTFIRGTELVEKYPNGQIPYKAKRSLFERQDLHCNLFVVE
jgi:hypothetical protein